MIVYDATSDQGVGKGALAWLPVGLWAARIVSAPPGLDERELKDWTRSRLGAFFHADPSTLVCDALRLEDDRAIVMVAQVATLEKLRSRHPRARIALAPSGPWGDGLRANVYVLPDAYELVTIQDPSRLAGAAAGEPVLSTVRFERMEGRLDLGQVLARLPEGTRYGLYAEGADLSELRRASLPGAAVADFRSLARGTNGAFAQAGAGKLRGAVPYLMVALVAGAVTLSLAAMRADVATRTAELENRKTELAALVAELASLRGEGPRIDPAGPRRSGALYALSALCAAGDPTLRAFRVSADGNSFSLDGSAKDALSALEAIRSTNAFEELKLRGVSMDADGLERFTLTGRIDDTE
ncbi:MAG: hypothetical protein JXA15_13875 [Spirochaetales bacterium]|nr:hypothetical protein [Spirochaetales bacterium]